MSTVSITLVGIVQAPVYMTFIALEWTTIEKVKNHAIAGYAIQLIPSIIIFILAQYLYKRGLGFTFSVNRFKLAGENIVVLIILFLILTAIGLIFFFNELLIIMIVLAVPFLYLMYFAFKKQREDARKSSFLE